MTEATLAQHSMHGLKVVEGSFGDLESQRDGGTQSGACKSAGAVPTSSIHPAETSNRG